MKTTRSSQLLKTRGVATTARTRPYASGVFVFTAPVSTNTTHVQDIANASPSSPQALLRLSRVPADTPATEAETAPEAGLLHATRPVCDGCFATIKRAMRRPCRARSRAGEKQEPQPSGLRSTRKSERRRPGGTTASQRFALHRRPGTRGPIILGARASASFQRSSGGQAPRLYRGPSGATLGA